MVITEMVKEFRFQVRGPGRRGLGFAALCRQQAGDQPMIPEARSPVAVNVEDVVLIRGFQAQIAQ